MFLNDIFSSSAKITQTSVQNSSSHSVCFLQSQSDQPEIVHDWLLIFLPGNCKKMTNWSSTRTSTGTGSTVELDDRQLYQCIRLHVFNSSKTVSFILPDDKFKLMRYVFLIGPAINDSTIDGYRLTSIVTLPLCFHHQNRHQPSTVYGCNEGNKPSAINAVLGIPTRPASTAKQLWEG